jgi:hypothetical protein
MGGEGTRYMVMLEKDIADFSDSLKIHVRQPVVDAAYQIRGLRGASNKTDYLIITHEDFLDASIRLAKHKVKVGFAAPRVVLLNDILEQFSGGNTDPSAIRNFLLHVYRNWDGGDILSYVTLFGSGHYDYKEVTTRQTSFIPVPYISGRFNEDYYTLLDTAAIDRQHYGYYFLGRLPAKSAAAALDIVEKIIDTEDPGAAEFDAWRSRVLLMADDDQQGASEDGITNHMSASKHVADTIGRLRPDIDIRTLYLLEYEWDDRFHKPGATRAFINEINNGVGLVNWFGHGAIDLIADERLMSKEDVTALYNRRRYPVFSLFSCSIGKFDQPGNESLGEILVRQPRAGGIAVVSGTRDVSASANSNLSRPFVRALFDTAAGANITIGSALQIGKYMAPGSSNRWYVTLGDPSVSLFTRNRRVGLTVTDTAGSVIDTLKAMQRITIKGAVYTHEGRKDEAFGGPGAYVSLTLLNPPQDSVRRKDGGKFFYADTVYTLPGSPVFSDVIPVGSDGTFEQQLLLPMNLTFGKPGVRLIAHAWKAGDTLIGSGHLGGLIFEGSASGGISDTAGPRISVRPIYNNISMDSEGLFVRNRITAQLPLTLEVSVEDENGINLIGNGPDEGLTMEVKGALSKRPINGFKDGKASIVFEENSLKSGSHELIISAQDLLGNVSR